MTSLFRIFCGLGLMIYSWVVYQKNSEAIQAGLPVSILGYSPSATPGQITMAFMAIGLIGVVLLLLGIAGLLRGKARN